MTAKPSYRQLEERVAALEMELTDLRDSEKLMAEKQDQLYKILDSLDAIVYVSDIQTYEILYANKYAEKLFGNIIGKTCWQVLQADMTGPCPFCKNSELLTSNGKAQEVVLWEIENFKTGNWYSVRDRAIDWFDGRVVHLQIAVDITNRKKAEAALQASEVKFRTVADFTYDWEYWLNEEGVFNYMSPSCERITGHGVDAFMENPALLLDIIHPDDKEFFREHLKRELSTQKICHLDFRILDREGDVRWVSHYCQPVYDRARKLLGRRASNRDITVQRKAQENIELNQMRQATLLKLYEMQAQPVNELYDYVLDASLPLTLSDIGFLGFVSQDESQMTIHAWSKGVMEQCLVHNKPLVFNVAESGIWGEAIRQKRPVIINDYAASELKKGFPDGHVEISRFMAVPLIDDGKIVAMAAVGNKKNQYAEQDVKQLQLLIEGMWQIIRRRRTEEKFVRQAEMIKHFTNKVSHDLKNPAIAVHGLARLIERKFGRLEEKKLESYIKQIVNSSGQIVSLSEDINAYISTREMRLHYSDIKLKEIWQVIREEFSSQLRKREVSWLEPETDLPPIRADKQTLLRVYRNLVDNALKYGGRGLTEIGMGYEATDMHHVLSVHNNGEPIPADEAENIFKLFERKTNDSFTSGTGLGLAIVKEIAAHHKGDSWVDTGDGTRTTFYISIARDLNK